jgi:hypothetical protein
MRLPPDYHQIQQSQYNIQSRVKHPQPHRHDRGQLYYIEPQDCFNYCLHPLLEDHPDIRTVSKTFRCDPYVIVDVQIDTLFPVCLPEDIAAIIIAVILVEC